MALVQLNGHTSSRRVHAAGASATTSEIVPGSAINGTSIGLYAPEARLALDLASLQPGMVVADVVFNPVRTRFLDDADARGCRALDGLGMLVNQGIVGVQYWTGLTPDAAVMRHALEAAMGV